MWAIDGGAKWRGLAINGRYYFRWLSDFEADGPLPLVSTFDHVGELPASYFIIPKKFMLHGRGSGIVGQMSGPEVQVVLRFEPAGLAPGRGHAG
jgi:hypothetical protein